MSVSATDTPFILTAQGDNLADVFQGKDDVDTTPVCKYCCTQIRVFFGGDGPVILLTKPGGRVIFMGQSAGAGDIAETQFATPQWLSGCYVEALPGGSQVHLYVA